jgi:uncharacterized surface protein with fasciclin (FAS1) repeats
MNNANNATAWVVGFLAIAIIAVFAFWIIQRPVDEQGADENTTDENGAMVGEGSKQSIPRIERAEDSVTTIANDVASASRFIALSNSTNVAASLQAGETYTVFVPTNGAFDLLAGGTLDNLSAAELRRLVEYHVVMGRAVDLTSVEDSTIQAMSGDMLNFSVSDRDEIARVNSAIAFESFVGRNGIVYAINNVLLPPEE